MNIFFVNLVPYNISLMNEDKKLKLKYFRIINVNAYCDSLLSPCRLHLSGNYENQQSFC